MTEHEIYFELKIYVLIEHSQKDRHIEMDRERERELRIIVIYYDKY